MAFPRRLALGALCLALAGLFCLPISACGGNADAQEEAAALRIGYFPNLAHAQALIIRDQGWLEEALGPDYTVEWFCFNAGPAEVEAMFAGEVDVGYIGPGPAVSANIQSEGWVRVIAGATGGGSALVAARNSGLSAPGDLADKVVTVPQLGNTQHLLLLSVLDRLDLSPSSLGGTVEVTPAANSDVLSLLDQEGVDAAILPEPYASLALEQYGAYLLLDYDQLWPGQDYAAAVVIGDSGFLAERPQLAQAFLDAHLRATDLLTSDPETACAIVNRQLEELTGEALSDPVLSAAFARTTFSADLPEESVLAFAQIQLSQDYIDAAPDPALLFDGSILAQAQESAG